MDGDCAILTCTVRPPHSVLPALGLTAVVFTTGLAAIPQQPVFRSGVDLVNLGVAGRLDDAPQTLAMRVLDDHAVRWREIDFKEGVTPLRVRQHDRQPVVVETPPEGTVLDEELDWERGGEDLMQRADQEFVLADRETLHI